MRVRRTLAALCAIAPLVWAASGCSDSSGGQVIGTRGLTFRQSVQDPVHDKCHAFAPKARSFIAGASLRRPRRASTGRTARCTRTRRRLAWCSS